MERQTHFTTRLSGYRQELYHPRTLAQSYTRTRVHGLVQGLIAGLSILTDVPWWRGLCNTREVLEEGCVSEKKCVCI